jgi:hypothetical protein
MEPLDEMKTLLKLMESAHMEADVESTDFDVRAAIENALGYIEDKMSDRGPHGRGLYGSPSADEVLKYFEQGDFDSAAMAATEFADEDGQHRTHYLGPRGGEDLYDEMYTWLEELAQGKFSQFNEFSNDQGLEEQDLSFSLQKDLPVNQTAIRNLKEIPGDDKWTMVQFDYLLNIGPTEIDSWKRAAMRGGWQWVNAGGVKKNVLTLTFMKPKTS